MLINCTNCNKQLTPVYSHWEKTQCLDALEIVLRGGYGMYFDGMAKALFCKQCSDDLLQTYSSLKGLI